MIIEYILGLLSAYKGLKLDLILRKGGADSEFIKCL